MQTPAETAALLEKMRRDWDQRARENARFYVVNSQEHWTDEEFFEGGQKTLAHQILTDMGNICQGRDPGAMKVLEIGCGAGRVTRALAGLFGEVHAVDVSGEMVQLARSACASLPNAFIYQNNGRDLEVLGDRRFDFAFSSCCFQHIPSYEVIESYVREIARLLRDGALLKFEVQGFVGMKSNPDDTWLGVPFSDNQVVELAERCGFEARHRIGAGTEQFWLWFFKRP
jgi:ubiquinone/menaquinone biosynthesis C-methylase UbiE